MFGFDKSDAKLILNFFKITVKDKYMGSKLGGLWAIANPLLMMGIYTFVFAFVLKARLPGASTSLSYSTWLISGYGPWMAINEAIMAATVSVIGSAGIVKNMVFKTEILPISYALTAIVPLTISLVFLVFLLMVDGEGLTWYALFLIPVILLQFFFVISLGFFLSAITVFIRDISIVLPNLLMIILFVSPIFYPVESMPHIIQMISRVNPFFIITEGYRQPLIHHHIPNVYGLLYILLLSVVLSYYGLKIFRRTKGYFTSML